MWKEGLSYHHRAMDEQVLREPKHTLVKGLMDLEEDLQHFDSNMSTIVRDCSTPLASTSRRQSLCHADNYDVCAGNDDILRLARRRRHSLAAPPEYVSPRSFCHCVIARWQPGLPMVGFSPPWPQPEFMRAGALGKHGEDPSLLK